MSLESRSQGKPRRPFLRGCLVLLLVLFGFFALFGIVSRMDERSFVPGSGKVAVLPIVGLIDDSEETIRHLKEFVKDDSVKAIVVRIDSGGGGVGPSQEIHEEVGKAAAKKPVVVSMGSMAASGGYYIACAAKTIVANPGTITGSIGVIIPFMNLQGLAEKIGVKEAQIKSGRFKDAGSPLREMDPDEKALLQAVVDNVHQQFVRAIVKGRNLSTERVSEIADGRILSGEQALAYGLVDRLGNLEDAVEEAGKLGGIEGEPEVVRPPEEKLSLIDLIRQQIGAVLKENLSTGRFRLDYSIR